MATSHNLNTLNSKIGSNFLNFSNLLVIVNSFILLFKMHCFQKICENFVKLDKNWYQTQFEYAKFKNRVNIFEISQIYCSIVNSFILLFKMHCFQKLCENFAKLDKNWYQGIREYALPP